MAYAKPRKRKKPAARPKAAPVRGRMGKGTGKRVAFKAPKTAPVRGRKGTKGKPLIVIAIGASPRKGREGRKRSK